jgi:hypothetical protein
MTRFFVGSVVLNYKFDLLLPTTLGLGCSGSRTEVRACQPEFESSSSIRIRQRGIYPSVHIIFLLFALAIFGVLETLQCYNWSVFFCYNHSVFSFIRRTSRIFLLRRYYRTNLLLQPLSSFAIIVSSGEPRFFFATRSAARFSMRSPVSVLWSNYFCYDEAKIRFFLLPKSILRDLDKNNFCYNYTNILLQATHFCFIAAICRI